MRFINRATAALIVSMSITTILSGCQQQPPPLLGTCRTNHGLYKNSLTCSPTPAQVAALSSVPIPVNATDFESVYTSYSPTMSARFSVPLSEAATYTTLNAYPGVSVDGAPVTSSDTSGGFTRSLTIVSRPTNLLSVYVNLIHTQSNQKVNVGQIGNCNNQDIRSSGCSPTQAEITTESGVPISPNATQFTSTYEGFTDWRMGATFRVPLSDSPVYLSLPNFPGVAIGGPEVSGVNDGLNGPFKSLMLRIVNGELKVSIVVFTT